METLNLAFWVKRKTINLSSVKLAKRKVKVNLPNLSQSQQKQMTL